MYLDAPFKLLLFYKELIYIYNLYRKYSHETRMYIMVDIIFAILAKAAKYLLTTIFFIW